ncbi:MAG: hypothetical protein J0L92_08265 [Deltaproteobacteria bacterium]|nr:hypothetical protein [Deltaproteobacteria bacterium]
MHPTHIRDFNIPRAHAALDHLRSLAESDRAVAAELPRIESMVQRGEELATLGLEQDNTMMIGEAVTLLEAPTLEAPPHVSMALYLAEWERTKGTTLD